MGPEREGKRKLLERFLNLAGGQPGLLAGNRLLELEASMKERAEIISKLKDLHGGEEMTEGERQVISRILALDADLRTSIEGELEDTRRELARILRCNRAHRAYARTPAGKKRERHSRDG